MTDGSNVIRPTIPAWEVTESRRVTASPEFLELEEKARQFFSEATVGDVMSPELLKLVLDGDIIRPDLR